jgi:hypothetical protein
MQELKRSSKNKSPAADSKTKKTEDEEYEKPSPAIHMQGFEGEIFPLLC